MLRALRRPWIPAARLAITLTLLATGALAPTAHAAASRMTGRVIDSDSQAPISGAEVEVANASGGQGYFRARTNGRGEFTIDRIPPGRWYSLTVGAAGYADFVLGGWQFPEAQRSVDLVIPLDRAGAIDVRLTRTDGKTPLAGARVNVQQERGQNWWEGYRPPPAPRFTDARGAARFEGLTAGPYTVTADFSGLRPAEARRVAVRRGETTTLPLQMTRPANLSGTVRLADGTPVAGVTVTARGPGEEVGTTATDGSFSIGDLAPGRYRLDVSSDGFETFVSRESYSVAEGGSREGIMLTPTPRAPDMAFVIDREAFLPGATIRVGLRSFRIGEVEVGVYRIPDARLLDAREDFRRYGVTGDTTGLTRVASWRHVVGAGPEWSWREGEVLIPETIAPGAYVLRGAGGTLVKSLVLFVTDVGLLVKRSGTQVLASVASLATGRAVEDAHVYAVASVMPQMSEGQGWTGALVERRGVPPVRTDARGLVTIPTPGGVPATMTKPPGPFRLRIVAVSEQHGIAVADAPMAMAVEGAGDQMFLYTDRPLYRPGHTIHWKAFARKARDRGYALPDLSRVGLTLMGPDGASVDVPQGALSEHGSADGSIELPKELPLGEWTLTARAGNASGSASLGVLQYRKPEFSVEVTPDRDVYVSGDEVRFRIAASYFFGAPVFGATVRYNLFESRLGDDWSYEEGEEATGGYGRLLKSGETRTDLDGRAEVLATPARASYDRRLTLEVEVVDASNRAVSGRGAAVVGRGLFAVKVRPRSWVVSVGDPVPIEVTTIDHAGKPVSAAVTVELDQEAWNPIARRYTRSTRPLATATVTTDRAGRAQLSLTPSPSRPGQIIVRARAEDSKRNRITAQANVWAWDEAVTEYAYRYPALEVLADRERYAPGDTVKVLVNTEVKNAQVLATLEGRDLYDMQSLALSGGTGLVAFVVKAEHAPNAFVSVHVRKGREVHTRTVEIAIEAQRHDLKIALKPDREQYGPGDTARVDVETRDGAGRPVAAEVSVAVVDEAIFALRADATPDPHEVFYGRRPNWVTTTFAFPSLLLGGADKGGRQEPRRDFRDVALWAPAVQTGPSGFASVPFRFPDNLTTWRITSRGLTDETLVGRATAKTLVTKDIVARLAGPRFFVSGDEAALVSVVNNRAASPIAEGTVSLEVKGASLTVPPLAKFSAPARGESRAEWSVKLPSEPARAAAPALFTFRARTTTDTDALEVSVPVKPRAVTLRSGGGGVLDAPSRAVAVPLPPNLVRPGSQVAIDLSLSPLGMAVAGAEALLAYPYGCTEQTANAVLAATSVVSALKAAKVSVAVWEKPEERLAPLLRRLASMQLDEGGWGWWKPGEFDPYLTALALDALARAARLDLAPAEARAAMSNAAYRLPRIVAEVRSLDGEAYLLAHVVPLIALGEMQDRSAELKTLLGGVADNLYASRKDLGNAGLALAAQGFAELGRATQARELVTLLLGRGVKDASGLHWTADPYRVSEWFGEDLDATGHALAAIARVGPDDVRAGEVVRWLAARRTGMAWRNTRVTAPVAMALADYVAARPAGAAPKGRLRADWNGEVVLDRAIEPGDLLGTKPIRVTIASAKLKPGENRLVLSRPGSGAVYFGWDARVLVPSPGPDTRKETRLRVAREYLRAERTADRRGRPRYVAAPLEAGEAFRVGEQVMVRLTLAAPQALSHVMIEDPRVSGFEVDALLPDGVDRPWDVNAEERDDRAVFFIGHLDEGETVIEYLVRPELAGTFTALPSEAGGMYEPELLVRGGEQKLAVAGKK